MTPWKILVVDDEPDLEELISQKFRRQVRDGEYTFQFARDGAEALRLVAADPGIALVLSDINMPVMDGLTLLAEIAKQSIDLRVVIVSAYGDMTNIRIAMNRGAFDFLTKPIDMADLDLTVRKTLAEIENGRAISRQRDDALRMRANLARYFSPYVVEILAAQDEPLGPVRRQNVAILFADIVGFTGLAETMEPEDVMATLRQYHARMSKHVFTWNGTLEKFVGDALLATFGVPRPSPGDCGNALCCAEEMLAGLVEWNGDRHAAGLPEIEIGIGLNYGAVVLGDLGGEHGMSFTCIGDAVNIASRLQDLTRHLNTSLAVGEGLIHAIDTITNERVQPMFRRLRSVGEQRLRGRMRPLRVWVLGRDPS